MLLKTIATARPRPVLQPCTTGMQTCPCVTHATYAMLSVQCRVMQDRRRTHWRFDRSSHETMTHGMSDTSSEMLVPQLPYALPPTALQPQWIKMQMRKKKPFAGHERTIEAYVMVQLSPGTGSSWLTGEVHT